MPVQKDVVISINHNHFLGGVTMDSVEITLKVIKGIEEAIVNGYNRFYMNVDDIENGEGFLRILAMFGPKYLIVYEGTFDLDTCFQVLELLAKSKYEIKDFTTRRDQL